MLICSFSPNFSKISSVIWGANGFNNCKKVLYPLLTCNDKYIFENIDIAVMSGLKKEDILQEIKKYLVDKSNYKEQEKIKENKKD